MMKDKQADAVSFWLMELNEEYSIMNCDPDDCEAIRRMLPDIVKTEDDTFMWKLETISDLALKNGLQRAQRWTTIVSVYNNLSNLRS